MVEKIEIDMDIKGLQQQFVFNTPLSTAQCGCGESFAL
jgi:Fe-S cluster assembly iron-binding protein IscA